MGELKPVNDKQKAFIQYYLTHQPYHITNAYIATYGDHGDQKRNIKNASQIFNRPEVKAYKEQRQQEILEEAGCNAQAIAMKLVQMAFATKDDQYYTPSIQTKALDLLQKQLGIQQTKQKIDADVTAAVQFVEDIPNETNQAE